MLQRKEFVEYGDWVVVNDSSNTPRFVQATESASFSCKEGNFIQIDMVGKRYGGKFYNMTNTAFVHLLHPTAYLWPALVDFRTQILYQQDISLIQYLLDLKPGSVVIESGTGSGVLTTSLARSVAPHGHVHTFEFHPERVNKAKQDFIMNKVHEVVTVRQRDILDRGFPFFPQGVDAAFLDLPSPHDVIISVDRSLRPQGRICNFSPCIEQVQRVCLKLQELGYEDIITVEILQKEYELLKLQPPATITYNQGALLSGIVTASGTLPSAQSNQYLVGQASFMSENDRQMTQRNKEREIKNQQARAAAKATATAAAAATAANATTATDAATTDSTPVPLEQTKEQSGSTEDEGTTKRSKPNTTTSEETQNELVQLETKPDLVAPTTTLDKIKTPDVKINLVTRPKNIARGHTGYLTFARKRSNTTPQEGQVYAVPFTKSSLTQAK